MKGCFLMIITIIVLAILAVGLLLLIIPNKWVDNWPDGVVDFLCNVKIVCLVVGLIGAVIIGAVLCANRITYTINYEKKIYEREVLEYRLEKLDDNITGNELLYNDIVEFNNYLRETKKWANDPWTSWLWNQKIAGIDYIELPE